MKLLPDTVTTHTYKLYCDGEEMRSEKLKQAVASDRPNPLPKVVVREGLVSAVFLQTNQVTLQPAGNRKVRYEATKQLVDRAYSLQDQVVVCRSIESGGTRRLLRIDGVDDTVGGTFEARTAESFRRWDGVLAELASDVAQGVVGVVE